jgi:hypothetical protein
VLAVSTDTGSTSSSSSGTRGRSATSNRLRAGDDDLRAIAAHLGVDGDVTAGEGADRTIAEGDASVNGCGASWWYSSGQPHPGL